MSDKAKYPKRLIEVDLPIKRISAQATREKSIRHGHISTLHVWWARRPLAACRAVLCAALWPDPADSLCPPEFIKTARNLMKNWAKDHLSLLIDESYRDFVVYQKKPDKLDDNIELRKSLFHFIADFSNWDNSTNEFFLSTSRELTQSAHEALGGIPGTKPLVVDPFAGGGSIPFEALRVGADAFASDLNPVAVLLNKVMLEYIPKYGQKLTDEVRKWGEWIKKEAEKELAEFYPKDPDGATPIAYLWARTIICEGPGCGVEIPLMRSLWLAKKNNNSVALRIVPNMQRKKIDFEIIYNAKVKDISEGTIKRGSASCPLCGYTTPVASVRRQIHSHQGGASSARLFCVVTTKSGQNGRFYRLPMELDLKAVRNATEELKKRINETYFTHAGLSFVPNEPLPPQGTLGFRVQLYGMKQWGDLFTSRQLIGLTIFMRLLRNIVSTDKNELGIAVQTVLALIVDRIAAQYSSLSWWQSKGEFCVGTFGRQALPIVWDFCEIQPVGGGSGDLNNSLNWVTMLCEKENVHYNNIGQVTCTSAISQPLPDDSAKIIFTDPPYYDAVPYADLSDFFYVWLKRSVGEIYPNLFEDNLTPKELECVVDEIKGHDKTYFEDTMFKAMFESRRILAPDGLGIIVFAHKSTGGWEAQLQSMINAGWIITASWSIDTERAVRMRAQSSAALASSIHLERVGK